MKKNIYENSLLLELGEFNFIAHIQFQHAKHQTVMQPIFNYLEKMYNKSQPQRKFTNYLLIQKRRLCRIMFSIM
jgi:hypothetical protein